MPLFFPRFLSILCLALFALVVSPLARAQTAPAITSQPASKTVNVGTAVTFTVVASGTAPTYQWLFNGVAIAGATSSSYTIAAVAPEQAGIYAVIVANSVSALTSSNATLLVYAPYVVRTFAGQVGVAGAQDGTGNQTLFNHPQGMAADSSGTIYIADTANSVIRKMTPAGQVSIFAGQFGVTGSADGQGTAAQFYYPTGIAVDSAGYVYVADTSNSTIRKITPQGLVSTLAGLAPSAAVPAPINQGSTNGTGTAARFQTPRGVAVDGAFNVYVADTQNNAIRKITPGGVVTLLAGNPGQNPTSTDGTGTAARFNYPFGIASDANGNLWVADTSNSNIRAITQAGSVGVVTTLAGVGGNAGSNGGIGSLARFNQPAAIAVDGSGNLFVADTNNQTIRKILPSGAVLTLAGLAGNTTLPGQSGDGAGSNARFFSPYGVTADPNGNLYIADTLNNTIRIASTQPSTDVSPTIQTQPASQTVAPGVTVTLTVAASGMPAPTYQWYKLPPNAPSATAISGATSATLTLPSVSAADAAGYYTLVTNEVSVLQSTTATLTVLAAPTVPPGNQSQALNAGVAATFAANASGGNLTYQWQLNGVNIPGATGSTLTVNPVGTYSAGTYSVNVTNSLGTTNGMIGVLSVATSARLLDLSASGPASSGANVLSAGFVTTNGPKAMLIRGIGPALTGFGIGGALADPQLAVNSQATGSVAAAVIASGTAGWSANAATATTLTAISSQVGAFALASGSLDQAAYLPALAPGNYTALVSGAGSTSGQGMVEVWDADSGTPSARLVNLSARANSGTGTNILTGGFVIGGTTSESVLLRGIGPALTTFGVTGAMARPVLSLYKAGASTPFATNSAWGGSAAMAAIFSSVSAFPLPANSLDDALVQTLAPGSYTVTVTGANNTTGVAMVEIYELH